MHNTQSLDRWQHDHVFLGRHHARNERRTWLVVGVTAAMMVAEIVGGTIFGSMALLADGWHMSTHASALAIAALAYRYARKHAHDRRFTFGTGKLGELAGFASAVVLATIAVLIALESAVRLARPASIAYEEAIAIAILGLAVNLLCAWLLREQHQHDHGHADAQGHGRHGHHHTDHNLRAAYLHVLADAATSLLAIAGLALGWAFGWRWVDPAAGLLGACVIASWSYGLIRSAGAVLLDIVPDEEAARDILRRLEADGDRVADFHLWQVGPGHRAAVLSIVTDRPQPPSAYKRRLRGVRGLSHVTIEVEPCTPDASRAA